MNKYNIIGKGSYGYIFYPSIHQLDKNEPDNEKYISKLLLKEHAEIEINNYSIIKEFDSMYKYHLGVYEMNVPIDLNLKEYDLFKNEKIEDLSLIITKYGGIDLHNFFLNQKINYSDIILFLNEFYRILKGIKLFNDNNIIHHDINPQNIVYDISNNRLNYIDFGLTNLKENIIKDSYKSNNEYSIFHSSFPLESGFYNKDIFNILINSSDDEINKIYKVIYYDLTNKNKNNNISNNNLRIHIENLIGNIYEMFKYYYLIDNNFYMKRILNDLNDLFKNIKKYNYNTFLNKSLNTFDLYGYGITLIYSLHFIKDLIPTNLFNKLLDFGLNMTNINIFNRISIEEALIIFEQILIDHDIKLKDYV